MAITLDGTTGITTADIAATTLTVNAGFGSNATAYGVRAWVNFDGTGTVAIRDSGNVSSITDHSTGNYTINYTNNMPDINYAVNAISAYSATANGALLVEIFGFDNQTVSGVRVQNRNSATNYDALSIQLAVIR
jgi:hypothetical protein